MNNLLLKKPQQVIIIGGGYSLKKEIDSGLFLKIKDSYTIGTNYSYRYFNSTLLCFIDNKFYESELKGLSKLDLIIGNCVSNKKLPNTISLPNSNKYNRDLSRGVYGLLTGIYALSLAIHLLDVGGEIYLLGFDLGAPKGEIEDKMFHSVKGNKVLRPITYNGNILTPQRYIANDKEGNKLRSLTHWYQDELEHPGIGKDHYYYIKDKANIDFNAFKGETKCKIFNVGLDSRINLFEKIDYPTFFSKLNNHPVNQDELRVKIRGKLKRFI